MGIGHWGIEHWCTCAWSDSVAAAAPRARTVKRMAACTGLLYTQAQAMVKAAEATPATTAARQKTVAMRRPTYRG